MERGENLDKREEYNKMYLRRKKTCKFQFWIGIILVILGISGVIFSFEIFNQKLTQTGMTSLSKIDFSDFINATGVEKTMVDINARSFLVENQFQAAEIFILLGGISLMFILFGLNFIIEGRKG